MQPESSDGFASVGTILPKEKAALLPGGLFACAGPVGMGSRGRAANVRSNTAGACWNDLVSPIAMAELRSDPLDRTRGDPDARRSCGACICGDGDGAMRGRADGQDARCALKGWCAGGAIAHTSLPEFGQCADDSGIAWVSMVGLEISLRARFVDR